MSVTPLGSLGAHQRLPLLTLYLTERCNSRCISCDYWRHGARDIDLAGVQKLLPDLRRLGTRVALLSGGEPLIHPEWQGIAATLRTAGLRLWLLTSGLSLAKYPARVAELFDTVTVSLDGTTAATYEAIRGLDAFDRVCQGIRAVADAGARVTLRVTLQRANYRELLGFIPLARELGVRQLSFLAVDVANPHAFARTDDFTAGLALTREDLPVFAGLLDELERVHAQALQERFVAESAAKLRRLHTYFSAVLGLAAYPPLRCNAPEFSAVLDAHGQVHPCFFIPGPGRTGSSLEAALNEPAMARLRESIRHGERPECQRCVCPLWRDEVAQLDATPRHAPGLAQGAA